MVWQRNGYTHVYKSHVMIFCSGAFCFGLGSDLGITPQGLNNTNKYQNIRNQERILTILERCSLVLYVLCFTNAFFALLHISLALIFVYCKHKPTVAELNQTDVTLQ